MTLKIEQSAAYAGNGRWNWSIWLAGSAGELDQVDHVIYTLHPSFSNPVREIRTRKGGFRLRSNGWGEFTIYVDVAGKDGGHQQLIHELKLEETTKSQPQSETDEMESGASVEMTDKTGGKPDEASSRPKAYLAGLVRKAVEKVAEHISPTTVFISGGVSDADAVRKLGDSMTNLNVQVVGVADIPAGAPYQVSIADQIARADMAVFLVSGQPSLWLAEEIEVAKRSGKPVIPVLVGPESQMPESLSQFKSMRISDLENVAEWVHLVLKG